MKKVFTVAFLLFMTFSFLVKAQTHSSARYMDPNDPNLNPNWDWTPSGPGYTMYYSKNGSTPIKLSNVQTPFYTTGHPLADALNNDKKDMWKQDGWMLAYKDFGTPTIAPAYPFFILYNKYRGTLRVMFYNAPGDSYTAYKAELSFRGTSPKAALLTFTDSIKPFINDYDGSKTETFLGKATPYQDWAYADFVVAGYDPNLSSSAVFHLEFYGVNESQLILNSKEFTMSEVLSNANPSSSRSTTQDVKAALNAGQKFYKDVANVTKGLKDAVDNEKGNPWWKSIASSISNSSITSMVPYVGGLLGFVTSFIGGKNTPAPREPMNFKGSLKLEGAITTTYPLLRVDLALSPGAQLADLYRPVQTIPWGIFNFSKILPIYEDYNECYCVRYNEYGMCDTEQCDPRIRLNGFTTPTLYFNPNLGMSVKSIRAKFLDLNSDGYSSYQQGGYAIPFFDFKQKGLNNFVYPGDGNTGGIGFEITLQVNSPTKNSDSEIIIYKVYPGGTPKNGKIELNEEIAGAPSIFPNPFSESTAIRYHLNQQDHVSLKIFDVTGKEIITLVNKDEKEGSHLTTWDGRSSDGTPQPNGIYVYRLTTGKEIATRKLILQK